MSLPPKPYSPAMPAGPPPLPPGPAPAQPYHNAPDQQAAHAAAWAAYYQAQGAGGAAAYPSATPSLSSATPTAAGATPNPYANYGYGPAPAHSRTYQGPGTSYRPAGQQFGPQQPAQLYGQGAYGQQGSYNPQPAPPSYAPPPQQGGYQPPVPQSGVYQGPGQSYSNHIGPQQPAAPAAGQYNPPNQFRPQAGYNSPQSFRPGSTAPAAPPTQTYRPPSGPMGAQPQHRGPPGPPSRPPINNPPPGGNFPPAKRPRFDAPGQGGHPAGPGASGNGPVGMMNNASPTPSSIPPRPPVRTPSGPSMGMSGSSGGFRPPLPAGPAGPSQPQPPSGPSGLNGTGGIGTGMMSGVIRFGASAPLGPPIQQSPSRQPFVPSGPGGMRGGFGGRGGLAGRGGRGGAVVNAPRGPSGMRGRSDRDRSQQPRRDERKDTKEKDRKKKDKEKEAKTTMTDFRIVGIEIKNLGWSWGLTNGSDDVEKVEVKEEPVEEIKASESVDAETPVVAAEPESAAQNTEAVTVKEEGVSEEKLGSKRKAETPGLEGDGASSPKKRASYMMTHGKLNSDTPFESNQNRFRIYFESPPELDRIPKALRRNPNKRWRRESSSVAPSRVGEAHEANSTAAVAESKVETLAEAVKEEPEAEASLPAESAEPAEPALAADASTADASTAVAAEETPADAEKDGVENVEEGTEVKEDAAGVEENRPPEAAELSRSEVPAAGEGAEVIAPESSQEAAAPVADTDAAQAGESEAQDGEEGDADDLAAVDISMRTDVVPDDHETAEQTDQGQHPTETPATDATEPAKETEVAVPEPTAQTEEVKVESEDKQEVPRAAIAAALEAVTNGNLHIGQSGMSTPDTAQKVAETLAKSAAATASAYAKSRARRRSRSSSSSAGSSAGEDDGLDDIVVPSTNRLSILYEDSSRRLCLDSEVVSRVKIFRKAGRIEVVLRTTLTAESDETEEQVLPKGILMERYDPTDQRFVPIPASELVSIYTKSETASETADPAPPLHKLGESSKSDTRSSTVLVVHLNKRRPLSEPKWCRTNTADEWLGEQFTKVDPNGWAGKLEVVDPDPAPTLQSLLESWTSTSTSGSSASRGAFIQSLLKDPNDLVEILLRLTRGERNAPVSSSSSKDAPVPAPNRTDSPYASHQTHVSLAILAMYRLTTDYAMRAGEKKEVLEEKIGDIIRSLPASMIQKSLEGMYKEWAGEKR